MRRKITAVIAAALVLAFVPVAEAQFLAGANAAFTGTAVDASGNTFVSGYFDGSSLVIGSATLAKIGTQDAFVAKINADGSVAWARNFGGPRSYAVGAAIAVDNTGNVYLSGSFSSANLTTPSLAAFGLNDAFAMKLDSAGTTIWARNFGGIAAFTQAGSIAVDGSGNVYLAGAFENGNLTNPPLAKIGIADVFAIKLDAAAGNTIWARTFGGNQADTDGASIAVDGSNSIYVAGTFSNADLSSPSLKRRGVYDAFVVKLNSTGALVWAQNFGGIGAWAYGQAVAVDSLSNSVYLSGYFNSGDLVYPTLTKVGMQDAFALRLDSTGALDWARNFGGAGAKAWGVAVATDNGGDAILAGFFYNASLTTPAMAKIGGSDAFAIKLDSTGGISWAHNYGGGNAQGLAVAADGAGNVNFVGSNSGAGMVVPPLAQIGATDAFAINLNSSGAMTSARIYGSLTGPANYQGLWSVPGGAENFWGINFAHQGDRVFGTWYTYDTGGNVYWLSMLANRTTPTSNVYTGDINVDVGPPFNNFTGTATFTKVGTGTLTFGGATSGTFDYQLEAGTGGSTLAVTQTKALARFDLGTGPQPTCAFSATANLAAATNYQDLWWAASGAESGWGINFAHQGNAIFATWYTYDAKGASNNPPMWLSALLQRQDASNTFNGPISRTSGPRFDNYKASDVVHPIPTVGSATVTFTDGNSAMFNYTTNGSGGLAPGVNQTKQITRFPFGAGGTVCQ